jgi:hypothetical protein
VNFVEILTLSYTPSWAPIHLLKMDVGPLWGKIWAILSPGARCYVKFGHFPSVNFVEILTLSYTPSWAPIHLLKMDVGPLWGKIWAILSPGARWPLFLVLFPQISTKFTLYACIPLGHLCSMSDWM